NQAHSLGESQDRGAQVGEQRVPQADVLRRSVVVVGPELVLKLSQLVLYLLVERSHACLRVLVLVKPGSVTLTQNHNVVVNVLGRAAGYTSLLQSVRYGLHCVVEKVEIVDQL